MKATKVEKAEVSPDIGLIVLRADCGAVADSNTHHKNKPTI
jgi:hypothetical protein